MLCSRVDLDANLLAQLRSSVDNAVTIIRQLREEDLDLDVLQRK